MSSPELTKLCCCVCNENIVTYKFINISHIPRNTTGVFVCMGCFIFEMRIKKESFICSRKCINCESPSSSNEGYYSILKINLTTRTTRADYCESCFEACCGKEFIDKIIGILP